MWRKPKKKSLKHLETTQQGQVYEPYAVVTAGSILVGKALQGVESSPCPKCVQHWLEWRGMSARLTDVAGLNLPENVLKELADHPSAQLFFEIENQNVTRFEAIVFPFAECACADFPYLLEASLNPHCSFIFSPIENIHCVRYPGPTGGSMWVATVVGKTPYTQETVEMRAAGLSRDEARLTALTRWIARSARRDVEAERTGSKHLIMEHIQSGRLEVASPSAWDAHSSFVASACATSILEAEVNALHQLTQQEVLYRYVSHRKHPMLVVGANQWIHSHVPTTLNQNWDIHFLFYPNGAPTWVVGCIAFSRESTLVAPVFSLASSHDMTDALQNALLNLMAEISPLLGDKDAKSTLSKLGAGMRKAKKSPVSLVRNLRSEKLATHRSLWWMRWLYHCPKVSLRDVVHVEAHPRTKEVWVSYFKDGQPALFVARPEHNVLRQAVCPFALVYLAQPKSGNSNIRGIGTWGDFQAQFSGLPVGI